MLRSSIIFFVMGLLVFFLGLYEVGGVTAPVAKVIFVTFLIFSLISFIGAVTTGDSKDRMSL